VETTPRLSHDEAATPFMSQIDAAAARGRFRAAAGFLAQDLASVTRAGPVVATAPAVSIPRQEPEFGAIADLVGPHQVIDPCR
jgi:hypothetical protein